MPQKPGFQRQSIISAHGAPIVFPTVFGPADYAFQYVDTLLPLPIAALASDLFTSIAQGAYCSRNGIITILHKTSFQILTHFLTTTTFPVNSASSRMFPHVHPSKSTSIQNRPRASPCNKPTPALTPSTTLISAPPTSLTQSSIPTMPAHPNTRTPTRTSTPSVPVCL